MGVKTKYTRKELIEICERAIVPESKWDNRDSEKSHCKLGKAWALLKAGCEFQIMTSETEGKQDRCVTDSRTIWVRIWSKGFSYFENGGPEDNDGHDFREEEFFYLPTPKRLDETAGRDWY